MSKKLLKGVFVGVAAVVVSTVGIFASDSLRGIDSGLKLGSESGACQEGSVPIRIDGAVLCVDVYEASASTKCPNQAPASAIQSEQNANTTGCYAASIKDALPWTYISLPQAQRMCAGAGKRLPTSKEWYQIALGSDPQACIIRAQSVGRTGTEACVSTVGAHDSIGNVWEWVNESVSNRTFDNRELPEAGYVTSVDVNGVAVTSSDSADELYGKDYFISGSSGVFGMIRGGFYGSNDDAGLYAVNASVPTSFATQGVGFRCVADVL